MFTKLQKRLGAHEYELKMSMWALLPMGNSQTSSDENSANEFNRATILILF